MGGRRDVVSMPLHVAIVGGIYMPGGARSAHLKTTPETTLEDGLREAGHQVTTLSHYDAPDCNAFDVVHVHHLSYGALRMAADQTSVPFVFTPHDASRMNGARTGVARECAMRCVLARADGIVSLSDAESAFVRSRYHTKTARRVVIPNGINTSVFTLERRNAAGKKGLFRLLFVGQLIPLKGCELLVRALALLPSQVQLSLVYQNDAQRPLLDALAVSLGIADHVHFLGKRTPAELNLLYQEHDVLVLPSETEALPSVISEAMLCGLPFVASKVGGIPDQSAGFGVLFSERTPEALAHAIRTVLDSYRFFEATGPRMRATAEARFSIPAMIAQHVDLYRSLQGAAPRRAHRHLPPQWLLRAYVDRVQLRGPSQPPQLPKSRSVAGGKD
jgi:glycosyltransferase involved in cell wall biosynthesis